MTNVFLPLNRSFLRPLFVFLHFKEFGVPWQSQGGKCTLRTGRQVPPAGRRLLIFYLMREGGFIS